MQTSWPEIGWVSGDVTVLKREKRHRSLIICLHEQCLQEQETDRLAISHLKTGSLDIIASIHVI